MDYPFSQPKLIYKLNFNTIYKNISLFENYFSGDEVLGFSAFEIESKTIEAQEEDIWQIEVYFADTKLNQIYKKGLKAFSEENKILIIGKIDFQTIEDKDWVLEYQKQLRPINIGKFHISSMSLANLKPVNSIPIIIEASRAFGTGEHSTTAGCIEAMEKISSTNFSKIYDIGTGSGILSFVSSKLWPTAEILACDIEEISIEIAKFNQQFNKTRVNFYRNSPEDLNIPDEFMPIKFDLIVSNILARPLIKLAPAISSLLDKNGKIILSGFLDYQTDEVISAYKESELMVENIIEKQEWRIITLISKS